MTMFIYFISIPPLTTHSQSIPKIQIVQFPINKFYLPKKRVFYIGFRYVGSVPCQEVQNLFLKRKGLVQGIRWWAMITYAKYDENDSNKYSIELKSSIPILSPLFKPRFINLFA